MTSMKSSKDGAAHNVAAISRLRNDLMKLNLDPPEFIHAAPNPRNIFEWYYVLEGPPGTPYYRGMYLGMLKFPKEYPFKPPTIMMLTPNGRFQTNTRLCLSISDFHPESWNPAWTVTTILVGVLSFMTGNQASFGSMNSSQTTRQQFAENSISWCLGNSTFCELFPELREKIDADPSLPKTTVAQEEYQIDEAEGSFMDWIQTACCIGVVAYGVLIAYQNMF